jgi:hypothetical protein
MPEIGYNKLIAIYAPRALQRWLRPENDEPNSRALAREMDIVRYVCLRAYKILFFTTCLKKKWHLCNYELMRAL